MKFRTWYSWRILTFFLVTFGYCWGEVPGKSEETTAWRIATFRCDVTPPVGGRHPLIWLVPVKEVETPLEALGIVLDDGKTRYVVCSMDWCGVCNSTYQLFCDKLAQATGIPASQVILHTVHQHTAPYTDGEAQRILTEASVSLPYVDFEFLEAVTDRFASAVKQALKKLEPVDQVGFGAAIVEQVASNRRVWTPEGKLVVRYSSCKDSAIRALPEGLIDPYVRTVTFARQRQPMVRLHFYATHPQSFYGDPRASADVPGFARARLEKEEGIPQIYFTGCAGNITMGKYNDGSREARDRLTERLYRGMREAVKNTRYEPLRRVRWRTVSFHFVPRSDRGYTAEDFRRVVNQADADPVRRIRAAGGLAFLARQDQPFVAQALFLNDGAIINLPGECFIEYQLFAQKLRPDSFVAVAAYGDLSPGYVCTEKAYAEGGYEPTASFLAPENEAIMKKVLTDLLQPGD